MVMISVSHYFFFVDFLVLSWAILGLGNVFLHLVFIRLGSLPSMKKEFKAESIQQTYGL